MAQAEVKKDNLFASLRRLFSTDVIIRNTGTKGGGITVMDTDNIQTTGVIQTNSLIDRFHKVYTTSTAYGVNLNLAQNYQSARVQIYADYDAMDTDAIISSALDIISDECTLKDESGTLLHITSADENIQNILEQLFYSVLNIEFNLWGWVRNMCIDENTMIPLLDGREISIKNLAQEIKNNPNKEYWTYSVQDKTNKVVPGKIIWCDRTRQNADLVRVTLDDGTYLDVTPDHKFILRNGDKKSAESLQEGESLMPFYTSIETGQMSGYEKIYNPGTNRQNITHRLVAHALGISNVKEENKLKIKCDTHHKNFNKRDNSPSNLQRLTKSEHTKLHNELAINNLWSKEEIIQKRKKSIDAFLRSDTRKKALHDKMIGIYPERFKEYNENKAFHNTHNGIRKTKMMQSWNSGVIEKMQELSFGLKSMEYISSIIKSNEGWTSLAALVNVIKNDSVFLDILKKENPKYRRDLKSIFYINRISTLISKATGKNYYDYVINLRSDLYNNPQYKRTKNQKESFLNHKVLSVVKLENKADTYCMNVVGPNNEEDRHNFAVCSNNTDGSYTRNGVFISNCKYGDFYLKMEISENFGIYNVIPFSAYNIVRQEGFNPHNPNEVRFKFDPNAALGATTGYTSAYNNQDPGIWFDNYEMAHFRFTGDVNYLPYGKSYLENARKLFKQYTLIEDAMLIHRIVRAPDKRAYYVNVGAIPPAEVENYVQRMMNKMKKTPLVDPQTGQYNMMYNVQNMLEDYFIPFRGNGDTTRIDTIPGLTYNGIEDVQYFREKVFAALKIPKAFMGYEKDLCIVPETKIPLLNGEVKTVSELIEDFENGVDNYTYSIDEKTNNIVPGKILWAGYTRKNADLVRVWLDNNKFVDCTPDHNFMTRDGQWIEAQNLKEGQSLMPIYFDEISKGINKGYTTVYNPCDGKYKEVHRLVPEYYGSIKKGSGKVVHHMDFNKKNNYPNNLDCSMSFKEHRDYHKKLSHKTINSIENILKRTSDKNWIESTKKNGRKGGLISGKKLGDWVKKNGPANKFIANIDCLVCGKNFHPKYKSRKFCGMNCRNDYYKSNKDEYNNHLRKHKNIDFGYLTRIAINCASYAQLVKESNISRHVIFTYFKNNSIDPCNFIEEYMPKALLNSQFIRNYKKEDFTYMNHKVKMVESLDYKKDTCDLHIEDHHNFAVDSGVIIHNSGKATLAAEDIRFARTIERIQRIIVSELKKIALVHLYANGYTDESVANFQLSLTGPSIIYEQERLSMLKEKVDLINQASEAASLPRNYLWKNVFHISEDEFEEMDDMIVEDQKRKFRYKQIQEEGNDPSETGQAFGTPHQLASLYGGKMDGSLDLPSGYDELDPNRPTKVPGRPQKYKSTYATDDSPFGRDRLGSYDLKANAETGEDSFKPKFKGGPLNLENTSNTRAIYAQYENALKKMFPNKKKTLLESSTLDESNILEDLGE